MTDRDPMLQTLFADAERDFTDDAFVVRVAAGIARRRRRIKTARTVAGLILLLCLGLAAVALPELPLLLARGLGAPLIDIGDGLPVLVLGPLNSVAGLAGIGFLILRAGYRRVFA